MKHSKNSPQHADGHGEAKCRQRHEKRRQREYQMIVVVENNDQRKAHRRGQKAVQRVQNGVPERNDDIKRVNFTQNFGGEDKTEHRDFQRGRQFNPQLHLNPAGDVEQDQRQGAEKETLIAVEKKLAHHGHDDQQAQNGKHQKRTLVFPQLLVHGLLKGFLAPALFSSGRLLL
jgi:hypothetical protein